MASSTPNQEGPNIAPPPVPEGWIAQWDGQGRRYYFVQLTTRASQWEVPTQPAPGILTPGQTPVGNEHPYGKPESQQQQGHGGIFTNADGSQNMRYPDGSVYPPHHGGDGGNGERGLGAFAMQQLLHSGKGKYGSNNNQSSSGSGSGLTGLASQFLSSGSHNSANSSSGAGGIVGSLAGSLLGGKKPNNQAQTSYSGSAPQQQQGGGGFLGGMFGSNSSSQGANYGYSNANSSNGGSYSGQAPPTSYQPGHQASTYGQPQHQTNPQYGYNAHQPQQPPSQYSGGAAYGAAPSGQFGGQQYGVTHNPTYNEPLTSQNPAHHYQSQSSNPMQPPPYGSPQHVNSGVGSIAPPHPQHQNSFGSEYEYGQGAPSQAAGGYPHQQQQHAPQPHHPQHYPQHRPGGYPPQGAYSSPGGWEGPPKPYDQAPYFAAGAPPPIPSGSRPNHPGGAPYMHGGGGDAHGYQGQGQGRGQGRW